MTKFLFLKKFVMNVRYIANIEYSNDQFYKIRMVFPQYSQDYYIDEKKDPEDYKTLQWWLLREKNKQW